MKIFVTGATGAIGRHAVEALVDKGHLVKAVARSEAKAAALRAAGATPVVVSLFDRGALVNVLRGHDALVNLATAIPPSTRFMSQSAWNENNRLRIEGSETLVDAAIEASVERYIQESVSMLYSDGGDRWLDEESSTDRFPFAVGNHAAEASANRFTDSGGVGVILRFGWFYGPGATHSEEFFEIAKRVGVCVKFGKTNGYLSSIEVSDGGRAVESALSAKAGTYNVVDNIPLTKNDYADAIACAAGRKYWIRAPGRLAYLLGNRTTSLTRSLRVSNSKFREETGWQPKFVSAREGWHGMAEALSASVQ